MKIGWQNMKIRKKKLIIFLWKINLIIFGMKQPLFPLSAFKYDKKIIEIREVVRVEMSAIIHCAMICDKIPAVWRCSCLRNLGLSCRILVATNGLTLSSYDKYLDDKKFDFDIKISSIISFLAFWAFKFSKLTVW